MTTAVEPLVHDVCRCTDPDLDRLRAYVAAGWGQVEASRLVWPGVPVSAVGMAGWVRAELLRRLPWLRDEGGRVDPLLLAGAWLLVFVGVALGPRVWSR